MIKEILKSFMKQAIETIDRIEPKSQEGFMDLQTKTALTDNGKFYFVNFAFITKGKGKRDEIFNLLNKGLNISDEDKIKAIKLREVGK